MVGWGCSRRCHWTKRYVSLDRHSRQQAKLSLRATQGARWAKWFLMVYKLRLKERKGACVEPLRLTRVLVGRYGAQYPCRRKGRKSFCKRIRRIFLEEATRRTDRSLGFTVISTYREPVNASHAVWIRNEGIWKLWGYSKARELGWLQFKTWQNRVLERKVKPSAR